MNYPQTVNELIKWDTYTERDTFGVYTVITGFEGTGGCFWCGKELSGRRRFCGNRSGHWTRYQEYFTWNYAKGLCLRNAEQRCANCGVEGTGLYIGDEMTNLRAHHIIPLNGAERAISVYNIPWNLVCLCHACHMKLHVIMRQARELLAKPDIFELAREKGQLVFELTK